MSADASQESFQRGLRVQPGVCPSCNGIAFDEFRVPERGLSIHICRGCGLYINAGACPPEEVADTYEGDYQEAFYGRVAARKLRDNALRMRLIESLCPRGKFLDIGCSLGYMTQAAAMRGWDAYGVDLSDYAVRSCRERGLQVSIGDMQHLDFADGMFDAINLRHVLEHDPELWLSLTEIRRVLNPRGVLIVEVPCVDCRQVQGRRERYTKFWHTCHYYWFSRRSVRNVLQRAGYAELPLPRFGRKALSGSVGQSLHYLGWRTHALAKRALGVQPYDVSAWRPT